MNTKTSTNPATQYNTMHPSNEPDETLAHTETDVINADTETITFRIGWTWADGHTDTFEVTKDSEDVDTIVGRFEDDDIEYSFDPGLLEDFALGSRDGDACLTVGQRNGGFGAGWDL